MSYFSKLLTTELFNKLNLEIIHLSKMFLDFIFLGLNFLSL